MMDLKRTVMTGLAALALSTPLAGCGTAQRDETPEPTTITYTTPSGEREELEDGHAVRTPKWFAGGLELQTGEDARVEPLNGATVTDHGVVDGAREYSIRFTGSESPRAIANANGRSVYANAADERVHIGDEFYDAVSVGSRSTPETQNALEELVAGTVGSLAFAGENRFYAVLAKDADGNYNDFHSFGAIAGPDAVTQAFAELYECAEGGLDEVRVRVLPGNFSGPESTYGAVVEAYANDTCIAQMLVGDNEDLAPIAERASQLGYAIAPEAAAHAYLAR